MKLMNIQTHSDYVELMNATHLKKWELHRKRVEFGRQPLTLGMFTPCFNGLPMEKLEGLHPNQQIELEGTKTTFAYYLTIYRQAQEKVLFEGFEIEEYQDEGNIPKTIKHEYLHVFWFDSITQTWNKSKGLKTVEDLTTYGLTLTPNAIKQLGL